MANFRLGIARQLCGKAPVARQGDALLTGEQMTAQLLLHGGATLIAKGGNTGIIERQPGGNASVFGMAQAVRIAHPGVRHQRLFELRQGDAFVFKFEDAIGSALQDQSIAANVGNIGGLFARGYPRRFRPQRALRVFAHTHAGQQLPWRVACAVRNHARFRAAVNIEHGAAKFLFHGAGGGGGQHAAGAEHAAHGERFPAAFFLQTGKQRRAGNPQAGRGAGVQ